VAPDISTPDLFVLITISTSEETNLTYLKIRIMKKLSVFIPLLMLSLLAFSQYTASNGITYNIGDTIIIGKGTATNGDFLYIQKNGVAKLDADNKDDLNMSRKYSDLTAVIKKIVNKKIAKQTKVCFTITLKPLSYIVYVESALESGELKK
jgi:hypothetical protein